MKLFTTSQIKRLDAYTIEHEPISSINLMERASGRIVDWLLKFFTGHVPIKIVAGAGNNGGDALAVARLLCICGYEVEVFLLNPDNKLSNDCQTNKNRLLEQDKAIFNEIRTSADFPIIGSDDWVIDGLFGSGLNRPLEGLYADIVKHINRSSCKVISIDIPSGLFGEDNSKNNPEAIIQADYTLSLQFPKIAFLLPENEKYVGKWEVLDIELHPEGLRNTNTTFYLTEKTTVIPFLKTRNNFSHKGTYGHALFVGGSYGKMGAAILAAKACLRTGVGLLSVYTPQCGNDILQMAVPEAMTIADKDFNYISLFIESLEKYTAIGIGCGIGTEPETAKVLNHLLKEITVPLVLDADALNILSQHPDWLLSVPKHTIITPHPKEMDRLLGETSHNRYEQLQKTIAFSKKYCIFVVLKGAYTAIVCPNGEVHFNSTGNAGMATGGSGDVLCGMILSLLAQGHPPCEAAVTATFLHGLAGDLAAQQHSQESLIASDIINYIGKTFLHIHA
jgi:NAD(P)H-hydrate epimerase